MKRINEKVRTKRGRMCEKCEMCKNVKEGKRERESIKWDKKHLGWDREVV